MLVSRATLRWLCPMALIGCFGLASIDTAGAVTAEQRAACTPDAMRLCSSEIPDLSRVKACMIANRANLSERCKSAFAPPASVSPTYAPRQNTRRVAAAAGAQPHLIKAAATQRRAIVARDKIIVRRRQTYDSHALATRSPHRQARFGQAMRIGLQVMSRLQAGCANQTAPAQLCQYQRMIPPGLIGAYAGGLGTYGGYGGY